jgi:hypothetical protein
MLTGEKGRKSLMNRILPLVSIFSDWCSENQHFLLSIDNNNAVDEDTVFTAMLNNNVDHNNDSNNNSKNNRNNNNLESTEKKNDSATTTQFIITHIISNKDLKRYETRSRSGLRASLTSIVSILEDDMKKNANSVNLYDQKKKLEEEKVGVRNQEKEYLKEHLELRGYLPLSNIYEVYLFFYLLLFTILIHFLIFLY